MLFFFHPKKLFLGESFFEAFSFPHLVVTLEASLTALVATLTLAFGLGEEGGVAFTVTDFHWNADQVVGRPLEEYLAH